MHRGRNSRSGVRGSGSLPKLRGSRGTLPELDDYAELPEWAKKQKQIRRDPRDILSESTASAHSRNRIDHRNLPARWATQSLRSSTDSLRSTTRVSLKQDVKPFPHKREKHVATRPPSSVEIVHQRDLDEAEAADAAADPLAAAAAAARPTASSDADAPNELGLLIELAGPSSVEDIADLIRSATPVSATEGFLRLDQSKLPIEMFDNTEFEKFSPNEWLQICSSGMSPFYSGGAWRWEPCDVIGFDEESDRYLISFRGTGKKKYVKRINLIFDAEDKTNFVNRLRAALISRERTKAAIRLQHFIDQQRDDGAAPVSDEWLGHILEQGQSFLQRWTALQRVERERKAERASKKALERSRSVAAAAEKPNPSGSQAAKGAVLDVSRADGGVDDISQRLAEAAAASSAVSALFAEVVQEYDISMKTSTLWRELEEGGPLQQQYRALRLPPPPTAAVVPYYAKVGVPRSVPSVRARMPTDPEAVEHLSLEAAARLKIPETVPAPLSRQFAEFKSRLAGSISYRSPVVLKVIQHTVDVWARDFSDASFVDVDVLSELPLSLNAFKNRQRECAKELVVRLANDWRRSVCNSLLDDASQVFNFYETDVDAHLRSPLHQLIRLLEHMMSQQLRGLVVRTCNDWVSFISRFGESPSASAHAAPTAAHGEDEAKVDEGGGTGSEGDSTHPSAPRQDLLGNVWITPLLDMELIVGHDGQADFLPSIEDIHQVLMAGLSTMITNVRACKMLEHELLSLCRFPGEAAPLLNIVVSDPLCADVDEVVSESKAAVKRTLRHSMQGPLRLVEAFNQYTYIVALDPESYVADFVASGPSVDDLFGKIEEFHEAARVVSSICSSVENYGLCRLHTQNLQELISTKALELRNALLVEMVQGMKRDASAVDDEYSVILARISEKPSNEQELVELRDFIEASQKTIKQLVARTDSIHDRLERLGGFNHRVTHTQFKHFWAIKQWPVRVRMTTEESLAALEVDKQRMMEQLDKDKIAFDAHLESLDARVKEFKKLGDPEQMIAVMDTANGIDADLRAAVETADDLNRREQVFGFTPTEYVPLQLTQQDFEPFYKLWSALSDFSTKKQIWITGPFVDLRVQAPDIERDVKEWWTMSYKLMKSLAEEFPGAAGVAKQLRQETDTFMANIPVIQALASPALEDRHWDELSEKVGKTMVSDDELTLQQLLDDGIMDHLEAVQEVYVKAQKEFNLKRDLRNMKGEWETIDFGVMAYKDSGTYVIKGVDDIMTVLDDQIVKVQTMMGHPFIKPILGEAKGWEKRLLHTQALIDEWLMVQRTWMYLEPIFGSEDIMRQMPVEGRRFGTVDALWRKTLAETADFPRVMDASAKEKLLDQFKNANKLLDQIQKGLNDYLEIKRLHFPRFFFLSNDELLEILSQTKEPRAVQPHLGKCFEGVARVTFRGDETGTREDVTITQLVSAENEKVDLIKFVDPNKGDNKGNVEKWLLQLLASMRVTVKDVCIRAKDAYPTSKRTDWVLAWPGQVVLNISQLFWTLEVENAIHTGGHAGLKEYEETLNSQLRDIVALVRGNLTKMERTTLGALCVIDVHARDVVSHMVKKNVEVASDFEWMSQLRYYWEDYPDDYNRYGENPENLMVRIVNAQQMYGYEYLGNSSRLVITPLTDRCYRTLMGAVSLMYGGAPAGPAGTGKTETTKDLAKAVAIQCVVFNCSDGLDYLAMAKFFKGLAASGAWACFDEFNRIELEVLSVIAQQILTIQKAKRGRVAKFVFEGTTLSLNPDANVFITMNPGYAGRSELPDNLKALFRPCAMMVPDYSMIAEIKLYSFGFTDARNMARKLTQVLRLSSEQLSSQKHYDYGMRAVFSILVRAGNLRQQLGDKWTEDLIVLSSINDVNLPKFTTNDIPLFRGITQDLFPGVTLPQPDYDSLLGAIREASSETNLQAKDEFVRSTVQLFETVQVRHGLMVVGRTCSGKTCVIRTLARAMTSLREQPGFDPVHLHTMNPKSITQGQLYGNFDENTHEWTDGVLAVTYRSCAKDSSADRHWCVFDGPVDAVWIENMNTVLDDNKKLCLNSGEIIKMSAHMTMIFEAEDLEEASPATVSRCGMVYMEPRRLGWRPSVQSWLNEVNHPCNAHTPLAGDERRAEIMRLFEWLVPPLLFCTQHYCTQLCPVTDLELVQSLLNVYNSLLAPVFGIRKPNELRPEELEGPAPELPPDCPKPKDVSKALEALFVQAAVWSIGIVTDTAGRKTFDEFVRAMMKGEASEHSIFKDFHAKNPMYDSMYDNGSRALAAFEGDVMIDDLRDGEEHQADGPPADMFGQRAHLKPVRDGPWRVALGLVPDDGLVYDYQANASKGGWVPWSKSMDRYKVPDRATFNSIMVPTVDSFRNTWNIELLATHGHHVLCVGDTGTGKSVQMIDKLMNGMDKERYQAILMNFSAQTSANMTQSIIDGKMNRRRKGVYGPPLGQRYIVFVDDLNMPAKETYGAQPPIELLRQWMDHGGWYDLQDKDLGFMNLIDVQFVAAMGPPGGGRTRITQRYVRHFNVLGYIPLDAAALQSVFTTILSWSLRNFPTAVKGAAAGIVGATIDVYETIAQQLLPTPAKSHYTFNLRDLSKVFQGMNQAAVGTVEDQIQVIRLWAHECMRVFHDRLIDDEDRRWFQDLVAAKVKEHFKKDWEKDVRGPNETLVYGNFVGSTGGYQEIDDRDKLQAAMDEYLDDYNNMSTSQMHLVLFMNAIEHVARISRIINLPSGNALLVGVGGSGRKSLTTLATFMADYELFQVEISKAYGMVEWRDDLKKMLLQAGKDGKSTVFLFSDTQIVTESFVEDINNILNNGEVPNVWEPDERNLILEDCRAAANAEGVTVQSPQEVMSYFVERCKQNLHVVLCFSPIGDAFRTRLRMFPSLVNCCTIDWFTEWPRDALQSVATFFMRNIELPDDVKAGVIDVCVDMQTMVTDLSHRFLAELRRHYYVTPTSYLELINTFKDLIGTKQEEVLGAKARYENGLEKLRSTEEEVKVMQVELEELQPQLKVASAETEAMLGKISVMQKEANEKAEVVGKEEEECSAQAAAAQAMKDECEAELAEAIPALEASMKALKTLKKSDISEVKAMKNPPIAVKVTMEAVCIMLHVKPKKIPNPAGKGKIDDYWEVSQKSVLNDTKFLEKLMAYDKDNIPVETMEKVKPYKDREDFQPDAVFKSSKAAGGLCKWVHAMIVYDRVAKVVAPKRAALKEASDSLAAAQADLAEKQAQLKEVQDRVAALQEELKATMDKKDALEKQVDDCSKKLDRAQRLIGGLGGEKSRWTEAAQRLQAQYDNVVGDIVLSAGLIAYMGAFTSNYREECIDAWSHKLRERGITCAEHFSLSATLGDAVQIRAWTIAKLPNDSFSIDNAIMLYKSKRWPLMIDPQGQANRWIRNTEADRSLKVVKQNQANFVRTIENAVQFGMPVLLENVPDSIDPVLESVIARQIVKQGGMMTIRVGDNTVEYDPNFRLYITTKLRNPHYPPEVCVQLNLLNFMATAEGLQDQMLGIVVKQERPDLEEQRERLILEDAENKRKLKEIEDKILQLLAASEGNILDDEELIQTLADSKVTSDQIMTQVAKAEKIQAKVNAAREGYQVVAKRASLLFFCIADLSGVDPMYQYSLGWFVNLFLIAIDKAEKSKDLDERLANLNNTFTLVLYQNVCRSLFEKDKLLFSFLLCIKILLGDEVLHPDELQFLLQGSLSMDLAKPNPTAAAKRQWLDNKSWADILALEHLPAFEGLADQITQDLADWEEIYSSSTPADDLQEKFEDRFSMFQVLLLLRCVRPDKVVPFIQQFVAESIGQQFIDPPTFDLNACYEDSNVTSPLIFVLSPGADPMTELLKLADKLGKSKQLFSVSLGQGQGTIAENAISEAVDKGTWVCLQNCHLAESWMPTLERICEEITADNTNDSFRLWLTAMPNDKFPVSVLQNGVKITIEPPKGMRSNLLGSYTAMDAEWFESCERPHEFKKLVFGLCFFHAVVRERRKFGPLGWNIPYEFSEPDLRISIDQLKIFLDDVEAYPDIPYEALAYLVGECNYGGRVTDDKDRRCILNILSDFYNPDILREGYTFSQSGVYFAPRPGPHDSYVEYIRNLPFTETPEVFGLHDNADISCAISETNQLLSTALSLQPRRSASSGKSADEELLELAHDISERMPELFDIEQVQVDYPVKFEESMNTVLVQELIRFNKLLAVVRKSLVDVQKAIKGVVVMSADLEALGTSMVKGFVPDMWKSVSYPSLKPLGSYVNDLLARLDFLANWIKNDKPNIYWISGFFFTQSFLTGTRQNFARKYTIPIDEIEYDFRVLSPSEAKGITAAPADGCYVEGLFLEGARWDADHGVVAESRPRELFTEMPLIHLLPKRLVDIDDTQHVYSCPVYKTSERRGALSTTGHSTNFVMMIWLPMSQQHTAKYWIKKGVAMLTQLDT